MSTKPGEQPDVSPCRKSEEYFDNMQTKYRLNVSASTPSTDDGFHDETEPLGYESRKEKKRRDTDSSSGVSELSDDDGDEDGVLGRVLQFSSFSHLFEEESGVFECEICGGATAATSAAEVDRHTTSEHGGLGILQYSQIFHRGGREWYEGSLYKCFLCGDFLDTSNDRLRRHLQGIDLIN